ncbi:MULTISPECIES: hypothetical protein [unclassified Polaribacter]|nr:MULTISPECIES: hypothetical protein [unclassified Polaribacter]
MVKAIQEQSTEIELLKSENKALKIKQQEMETALNEIKTLLLQKK